MAEQQQHRLRRYGTPVASSVRGSFQIVGVAFPPDIARIVDSLYPPARQALADDFAGITRPLFVIDTLLGLALAVTFWRTGAATGLRSFIQRRVKSRFLIGAIFALTALAAWAILMLPLQFYETYVLGHRFGLTRESAVQWFHDWAIATAIEVFIGSAIAGLFLGAAQKWPRRWPAAAAAAAAAFVLFAFAIFPELIAPLFNRYTPLTPSPVTKSILAFAARQGLNAHVVYEYDISRQTLEANAYVSGLGATQRIAIGDNLLRNFNKDEILYVVAHETGHYRLGHLWIGAATTWLGTVIAILNVWFLGRALRLDFADPAALAPIAVILLCFNIIITPAGNAISRSIEHQADAFAATNARVGDGGVRAFARLANDDLSPLHPPPFWVWYAYTHPPMDERIMFAAHAAGLDRNP